jgi:phosphoribosylanthranilate isomerase
VNGITVKICGLTRKQDVLNCLNLGVHIVGFVTEYPLQVPWNLNRTAVLPLLSMVQPPYQSCIVTGGAPEKVIELATHLRPSLVQLHYQETLEDTIRISNALREINIGVIKMIPPAVVDRLKQFGTINIEEIVKTLCKTRVYGLLVDSRVPANASEKGTQLNHAFYSQIISLSTKPVIIAGGINADNVYDTVTQTGTQFIDIMTGVESSPGVKDKALLSRLLSSLYQECNKKTDTV